MCKFYLLGTEVDGNLNFDAAQTVNFTVLEGHSNFEGMAIYRSLFWKFVL